MEFTDVVAGRYSCKKYGDRPVEPEALAQVLEAGRLAPTAKNLQEHHVYVMQSPEALVAVDEVTPCRYAAPVVLLMTYDATNVFTYPGGKRTSGVEDATIVATHMMLAATNEGLDSCWVNNFDPEDAKRVFALAEHEEPVMLLDLGYAAEGAHPLPPHGLRKSLDETVTYR